MEPATPVASPLLDAIIIGSGPSALGAAIALSGFRPRYEAGCALPAARALGLEPLQVAMPVLEAILTVPLQLQVLPARTAANPAMVTDTASPTVLTPGAQPAVVNGAVLGLFLGCSWAVPGL